MIERHILWLLLLPLVPAILLQLCDADAHSQVPGAKNSVSLSSLDAVADGRADAAAAIQNVVDAGLGNVVLPKGIFRLSKTIVVDLDKVGHTSFHGGGVAKLLMAGPGPALKFVGTHYKSADPEDFSANVWDRQRMPLVDGVSIVGDHPSAEGIAAVGTMQLTITRTHIRKVLHGVHLMENNRNVIVSECHIYENRGVGIFYDSVNLHQSNISACHISYCAAGGVVARGGNVRNIHISGCDIESNMTPDSPPTANVLIDCRQSQYGTGEVAITGCTIQHNNPSPDSANIRIIGRSLPNAKQDLVREGNVTITGNVLSDVKVNVHLRDCRGVTLVGNTLWQGYTHNLLGEDCSNIVVGANNLDRNPRYDYGNTQAANNLIVFRNSQDCTLNGLHVNGAWRGSAGVLIENCRRFNVANCTILDCDGVGLLLKSVSDSRVSDCLIKDDRPNATTLSLRSMGGQGNQFVDNLLGKPLVNE